MAAGGLGGKSCLTIPFKVRNKAYVFSYMYLVSRRDFIIYN